MYDFTMAERAIGCMILNTDLANSKEYPFSVNDLDPDPKFAIHRILYGTLNHLNKKGVKKATIQDIDTFIKPYKKQYQTFLDFDGVEYIRTIEGLAEVDNFKYYYEGVRKLSCLRDLEKEGTNITKFWSDNRTKEENLANMNNYELIDIIDYYYSIINKKKLQYIIDKDDDTTRKKAGDNGHEILKSFKDAPMVGLNFESKYLTTLWDGFRKGQLYIRSGDTSSGKSRSVIGDLACVCANEIYDIDNNKWKENPNGNSRGLYIGCEMALDEEVDPLMWSYLSGTESSTITKGRYDDKQQILVDRAIDVVNDDSIWLTDMPSFNIRKLEEEIAFHKKEFNIDYVAFDYILLNNSLVREFVNARGKSMGMRGDEVILELSGALKDMCKKYDVGIITASQVNADIKDFKLRDYQVLRGGKAMADKASGGSISMPITQQELKLVEPYIERYRMKNSYDGKLDNLFVETVYKSRFSEYPKECKVFSDYNLGNMRKRELFVTDKNFRPIDVKKTEIIIKK